MTALFFAWAGACSDPWWPKPVYHADDVITADVCGFDLDEVALWASYVPICTFKLQAIEPDPVKAALNPLCELRDDQIRNLIVAGDPAHTHHDPRALATTELWPLVIDGYIDTSEGRYWGGLIKASLVVVPIAADPLIGAHELGHMCGYQPHVYRRQDSDRHQSWHVGSPTVEVLGPDSRGMDHTAGRRMEL